MAVPSNLAKAFRTLQGVHLMVLLSLSEVICKVQIQNN